MIAAHDVEAVVGLPRAVAVLDLVEQCGDVAAPDRDELAVTPRRKDVAIEQAHDLIARPQAVALNMTLEPVGDDVAEALPLASNAGCRRGRA